MALAPVSERAVAEDPLPEGGYNPAYFDLVARIEEEHFWFSARRLLIAKLSRAVASSFVPGFRVLEVGCGTGGMLPVLSDSCSQGTVVGMDYFPEGLAFAKKRSSVSLLQADAFSPPFLRSFDLICAFDVIEHLTNDIDILKSFRAMLRLDGILMVTVPAHSWLWSEFDVQAQHCRRYAKADLKKKLIDAGFAVKRLAPFMASTLPLLWAQRQSYKWKKERGGKSARSELRIVPVLNGFFRAILRTESRLLAAGLNLPFGSSFVAIVQRRN